MSFQLKVQEDSGKVPTIFVVLQIRWVGFGQIWVVAQFLVNGGIEVRLEDIIYHCFKAFWVSFAIPSNSTSWIPLGL